MCVFKMPRFFLTDILFSDFFNFNKKLFTVLHAFYVFAYILVYIPKMNAMPNLSNYNCTSRIGSSKNKGNER